MSNRVDNGTTDLSNVGKSVANYPSLTYRFVAQYIDGAFQVARLILGAPPASWGRHTYDTVLLKPYTFYRVGFNNAASMDQSRNFRMV
jgi:hypothetical protein